MRWGCTENDPNFMFIGNNETARERKKYVYLGGRQCDVKQMILLSMRMADCDI